MYGLIGKIKAVPGQRDALISILIEGAKDMPGCQSYIVAQDQTDQDAIWVTEVWENKASHQASLSLASVQEVIRSGNLLLLVFENVSRQIPLVVMD